ncbi:MAG: undecaprenyldiphospho-muramoylpentapeptide beta-N-acetylglucosaminyltransferase, partial [Bacteroidia bacterium]|nr:undecaprenyldiphospho-muramoylpentapeptide beta-N-acetylglucosaminyltransferase [Bacteroidia bacterium]
MQSTKIILSGGGTGGHIFPAVAIANELKRIIPNAEILFVGAIGRMEMEKVPKAGYKIIGLPIAGLQRRLTLSNLMFPILLIRSFFKARKILKDFNPDVVIGTGGYASGPILNAAAGKGIPTLIQEQNSFAGITNKLLAKKVNKICVAYEGMEKFFPKEKIIFSGNPVRQDIVNVDAKRKEAQDFFKLSSSKKTVLIIGGSLGARTINLAINEGLKKFAENNLQLIWQTGISFAPTAIESCNKFTDKGIFAFDFIQKMDLAYAAADIVISRAGASSVSELCNTNKACILVPSPNVAEDHQTKNAMALVNKNAAILV